MYYILENDKIVLFDENYERLVKTLEFMPQYQHLEIEETNRPIIDFEFADTEEWQAKQKQKEQEEKKQQILLELDKIDSKRIRAICEGGENPQTQEPWLDYYNKQAQELRDQLTNISIE